ncbi:MAG: hypothetical protein ACYSUK_07245 [Planctomycetota bacterium]|jgi:hypothetical protein
MARVIQFVLIVGFIILNSIPAYSTEVAGYFTIEDGDDYETIEAHDPPEWWPEPDTIIDMTGGNVGDGSDWNTGMYLCDSSLFNVSGGQVEYLRTYNSSLTNISGGTVGHYGSGYYNIMSYDNSVINVYDDGLLFGGSFHEVILYDSSVLNVYGGDVAVFLTLQHSSTVNIYNGECGFGIIPYDNCTINVSGGYIDIYACMENYLVPETATVNVFGNSFVYNPNGSWCDGPGLWQSKLTGYGPDGTAITYWGLPDPNSQSNINLIPDFVPEFGVDLNDFAVLASAWKTTPGDDNWNPICDISEPKDGVIDENDLEILTIYWLAGK